MKLLKYYVLMSCFIMTVYSFTDYSSWKDGDGLTSSDKKLIKKQFTMLSRKGKVPKPEKILRTMVTYEGRLVFYLVSYEGDGSVCVGRLSRKFNSEHCNTEEMRVICQDNTPW